MECWSNLFSHSHPVLLPMLTTGVLPIGFKRDSTTFERDVELADVTQ
jgi:hypothetical protein